MIEQGVITDDTFDPETFDPATYDGPVSFLLFDDYPAISTALSAGTIDAFCVDRSILANYITTDVPSSPIPSRLSSTA